MHIHKFIFGSCSWFLIVLVVCFGSEESSSFGHQCANVRKAMQDDKPLFPVFNAFIGRIVQESSFLSEKDWETATWLICEYIRGSVRLGEQEQCIELVKPLFSSVTIPPKVKGRIRYIWQTLNPHRVSLKDLVLMLENSGHPSSPQDQLLLSLYNMTLHSSYENKKAEILFAKEQKNYSEALRLCKELQESLDTGACAPLSAVSDVEQAFLKRITLAIQWEKEKEIKGSPSLELLLAYCSAEEGYAQAVEKLIDNIGGGCLARTQEIDAILFAHALSKLPWDESLGEHELEVLISQGQYLTSVYAQNAYFSLLEHYFKKTRMQEVVRLLDAGKAVFVETHKKYPEYMFFLGKYWFSLGDFPQAERAFFAVLQYADRLGVSLAETYEYLGCLFCYKGHYSSAEEYFLKAYKGWGREEAGMGLYLIAALKKNPVIWGKTEELVSLSFPNQEFLKWINKIFSPKQREEDVSVSQVLRRVHALSEETFYGLLLSDMITHFQRESCFSSPIKRFVYDQLDREVLQQLAQILAKTEDIFLQRRLSLWKALYEKSLEDWSSSHQDKNNFENIFICCFFALSQSSASAIQQIAEAFSSETSLWQSSLRMVWGMRHAGQDSPGRTYLLGITERPWGDRLYLLQYSFERYFSADIEILEHLTNFPELFPRSPLLPLVYYLQSIAEETSVRKAAWLIKALEAFSESSFPAKGSGAWACIYYLIKLDLAETYLFLGERTGSLVLFEEIKEEWETAHHPYTRLIDPSNIRVLLEMRWIVGLARVYEAFHAYEYLNALIISHVEKRLFQIHPRQEYVGKMLAVTSFLCRELLTGNSS